MWVLWMVLYCMSCNLVLVVIVKVFLQICVQKSGSGDSIRSLSHFPLGRVIVRLDEAVKFGYKFSWAVGYF